MLETPEFDFLSHRREADEEAMAEADRQMYAVPQCQISEGDTPRGCDTEEKKRLGTSVHRQQKTSVDEREHHINSLQATLHAWEADLADRQSRVEVRCGVPTGTTVW